MNWQFTRRNRHIRFAKYEPMCFIFPVKRGALEGFNPRTVMLEPGSDLVEQFQAWSRSRNEFQAKMLSDPPTSPADKWQKRYYRGLDMHDAPAADHRSRLRLKPFVPGVPAVANPVTMPVDDPATMRLRTFAERVIRMASSTPPTQLREWAKEALRPGLRVEQPHPATCRHDQVQQGWPPLRNHLYGQGRIEICAECGSWRPLWTADAPWQPGAALGDATE